MLIAGFAPAVRVRVLLLFVLVWPQLPGGIHSAARAVTIQMSSVTCHQSHVLHIKQAILLEHLLFWLQLRLVSRHAATTT